MKENEASATAARVLHGLLYTATRPSTAHLVSPEAADAARRLMGRSPVGRARLAALEDFRRRFLPAMEYLLLPGISLHYALRKRWIEERVRAAMAGGARQVINLGAGFDTLLLRLAAEDPELTCIEIDHPASQGAKRAVLDGEQAGARLDLLPVDFTTQTLAERLPQAPRFDASRPSVVICEGVLAYLDRAETATLFRSVRELMGPGTVVVFTFLADRSPTGRRPYGPLLGLYLAIASEGIRLQISPEDLRGLLADEGCELREVVTGPALLERYGAPEYTGPIHDLEVMAEAVVA